MTVFDLFERLLAAGVLPSLATDGRIRLSPAVELAPDLVKAVKANRESVLQVLKGSEGLPVCSCSGPVYRVPAVDGWNNLLCGCCGQCRAAGRDSR